MKCKYKLYKTQFLPLLVRILKPMRFKCKIYKTQSLPLPLGVFKPKCKIYKTQVLLMSLSQGAVRSSQGNLEIYGGKYARVHYISHNNFRRYSYYFIEERKVAEGQRGFLTLRF
jgi:hypothetical protein